jgi:hypothetical protein
MKEVSGLLTVRTQLGRRDLTASYVLVRAAIA